MKKIILLLMLISISATIKAERIDTLHYYGKTVYWHRDANLHPHWGQDGTVNRVTIDNLSWPNVNIQIMPKSQPNFQAQMYIYRMLPGGTTQNLPVLHNQIRFPAGDMGFKTFAKSFLGDTVIQAINFTAWLPDSCKLYVDDGGIDTSNFYETPYFWVGSQPAPDPGAPMDPIAIAAAAIAAVSLGAHALKKKK